MTSCSLQSSLGHPGQGQSSSGACAASSATTPPSLSRSSPRAASATADAGTTGSSAAAAKTPSADRPGPCLPKSRLRADRTTRAARRSVPASGRERCRRPAAAADGAKFPLRWLRREGLQAEACRIIRVIGESMEPTLPDGCSVLVNNEVREPKDGKIFVIRTVDELIVKRALQLRSERWAVASDNPDRKTWPTLPWPRDAIRHRRGPMGLAHAAVAPNRHTRRDDTNRLADCKRPFRLSCDPLRSGR